MTDNEIIKALELCSADECWCDDFPYENLCTDTDITKFALDLINRQKAEIERLKDYPKCVYEYDGDITDYCLKTPCPNYKTVDAIKAEAVKEFAKRLKAELSFGKYIQSDQIDNLVKEMVGETV